MKRIYRVYTGDGFFELELTGLGILLFSKLIPNIPEVIIVDIQNGKRFTIKK